MGVAFEDMKDKELEWCIENGDADEAALASAWIEHLTADYETPPPSTWSQHIICSASILSALISSCCQGSVLV